MEIHTYVSWQLLVFFFYFYITELIVFNKMISARMVIHFGSSWWQSRTAAMLVKSAGVSTCTVYHCQFYIWVAQRTFLSHTVEFCHCEFPWTFDYIVSWQKLSAPGVLSQTHGEGGFYSAFSNVRKCMAELLTIQQIFWTMLNFGRSVPNRCVRFLICCYVSTFKTTGTLRRLCMVESPCQISDFLPSVKIKKGWAKILSSIFSCKLGPGLAKA